MSTPSHEQIDKIDKNIKYMSVARFVGITASVLGGVLIVFIMLTTMYKVLEISTTNKEVSQTIRDCIDPTGQCYKSGDRRSGAAVKTINETQKHIVTVAAYCAKQPGNQTLEQIEACVNKELNP